MGSARSWDPSLATPTFDLVQGLDPILQSGTMDCGATALTMLLRRHDGRNDGLPPGSGFTARELRDLARARGYRAHVIRGDVDDLSAEIRQGRPAIVGLLKPWGGGDVPHYEVVAGIDESRGLVATLDPARGWALNSRESFLREWEPAGRLLLVVVPGMEGDAAFAARASEHPELEEFAAGKQWDAGGFIAAPLLLAMAWAMAGGVVAALPVGLSHSLGGRKFMPKETWDGPFIEATFYFSAYVLGFPLYVMGYLLGLPCGAEPPPPVRKNGHTPVESSARTAADWCSW
jgi:hypothetical protein